MVSKRPGRVPEGMRQLLVRHLTRDDVELLGRMLDGWTINPFEFDRETGRCEVSDEWLWRRSDLTRAGWPGPGSASTAGAQRWARDQDDDDVDARWADEAEEWPQHELDVLLRACDVLSDHREELAPGEASLRRRDEDGEFMCTYEFTDGVADGPAGSMAAAAVFAALLSEHKEFQVVDEDLGSVRRLTVTFRYRADSEYSSGKSLLDWLADLASRLADRRPYRGGRL